MAPDSTPKPDDSTSTNPASAQPPKPDQPAADKPSADTPAPTGPAPEPAAPAQPPAPETPAPSDAPAPTPSPAPTPTPVSPAGTPAAPAAPTQPAGKGPAWRPMVTVAIVVIALVASGVAAYSLLKNKAKPATSTVKVGVMMAFTGGSSSMGYGEMKGIQLAQKQLGASDIELVQMDSQCDPAIAPQAMQRLIDQHVSAVIGDGCSSASVAALALANKNQTPMISPSASSPTLSTADDYFFRVVPPDTYQGAYLAKSVFARGIKSAAIFYTDEPYGQNMNKVFSSQFQSLGGKITTSVNATSGVINLASQMAAIKATKPQSVVFVSNSVVTGAAAIELARKAGITVPFFGGDGLYDQTLITNAQSAAQGLTITTFPTGSSAFRQLLLTNDQGEQLYAAAQGYDAFEAVYEAVKTGAHTGPEIKNALPKVSFDGVSAHIKFDRFGDEDGTSYKYALLQVKDGSFVSGN